MTTDCVLDALEQALYARQPGGETPSDPSFRQGIAIRENPL